MKTSAQPIKPQILIRILVAIIIVLAYLAGFYHSAWRVEQDKYQYLENQCGKIMLETN